MSAEASSHDEVGSDSQRLQGSEKGPDVQVSPAVEQKDRSVCATDSPTSELGLGAISRAMSQVQEVWPTAHGHKVENPHPHSSPRPGGEASRLSSTSRVSSAGSPRVHEGARLSLEAKMEGRRTSHWQPPGRGSSPFAQAAQGRLLAKHGSEGDEAQVNLAPELSQIISDVVKVEDLGRLGSTSDSGHGGGESSWAKVHVSQGHDGTPAHDPADSENSSAAANSSAEKGDGRGLEFGNIVVSRASSSESSRSHRSGAWRNSHAFHGAANDMQTKPQQELVDQEEFRRVASASSGASASRARRGSTAGRWLAGEETLKQKEVTDAVEECVEGLFGLAYDGLSSAIRGAKERYMAKTHFVRRRSSAVALSHAQEKPKPQQARASKRQLGKGTESKAGAVSEVAQIAQAVEIVDKMANIKGVKGHPLAVECMLALTKMRAWQLRLKALSAIPLVASNGDITVLYACIERLNDYHDQVRRAAVSCFRDSPGIIHGKVKAAKDLLDISGEYAGGQMVCIVSIEEEYGGGDLEGQEFETREADDPLNPFWNQDFSLVAKNPDTSTCSIRIVKRGCKGATGDVLLASANIPVYELSNNKDKALWVALLRNTKVGSMVVTDGAAHAPIMRAPSSDLAPAGSVQILSSLTPGRGIGVKGQMQGVIEMLQPALYDDDYRIRREALQVFSQHVTAGDLDYTQLLVNAFHDRNAEVRWAAVDGLRQTLATLDPVCCQIALESIAPLLRQTDFTLEFHLACMNVILIAGAANPSMSIAGPGSVRLIQIVATRLNHPHATMRRLAINAFQKLVPRRSREAIAMILPFLSDQDSGVRMAAFDCIIQLADSKLHFNGPPHAEDIETVRAVIEGYETLGADDGIDEAREGVYQDLGLRFAVAFRLGIYFDHRMGWDSSQHLKLGHIKRWADGEWSEIKKQEEIEFQRIKAEQRLVNNAWVKKARVEAGKDDKIPEYRGKLTGEHKALIDLGVEAASAAIQANWRRFFQQRKFARIIMNNKASAEKMFSSTKNILTGSSEREASGAVDKEADVYSGLNQCPKVLVPAATFPEPGKDQGVRPGEWGRKRQGQQVATRTRKSEPREIPVPDESHGIVTQGARRLGLSKHVAITAPHPISSDLSTPNYLTTGLPSITPQRPKNWGTPSKHAMRARQLETEASRSAHNSSTNLVVDGEMSNSVDGDVMAEKSFESHTSSRHEDSSITSLHNLRSSNINDSPKISSRPGSFSHDASSHSFHGDNKMPAPLSASRTPSRQDSYLPDDSFSPNTNEDGVIVLRKLGLRNLPKMSVVETKRAAFAGGNGKSLSASVNSSERISPRHAATFDHGKNSLNDNDDFKRGGSNKAAVPSPSKKPSDGHSEQIHIPGHDHPGEADNHVDHSFSKTILGGEHGHAQGGWLDTHVYLLTHAVDSKRRLSSIHDIRSPKASLSHADSKRRLSSIQLIQSPGSTASPGHANTMLSDVVDTPQHKNERRGSIRRGHEASIAVNAAAGRNLDGISKVVHHEKNDAHGASSSHK